jgi:hypothetical protein
MTMANKACKLNVKKGLTQGHYNVSARGSLSTGVVFQTTKSKEWIASYKSAGVFGSGERDRRFTTKRDAVAWLAEQFGCVARR